MKRHLRALAWPLALLICAPASAMADDGIDLGPDHPGHTDHRGRVSLAFQSLHSSGLILDDGTNNRGAITDTRSMRLSVDYLLDGGWALHASVPYIRKRSRNDSGNHDPLALDRPHPESTFLDDGNYHGALQDYQFGLSRHITLGRYELEPRATLTWPSHDYTFFANAAVGQRLRKLRFGVDVTRRLPDSNFYWTAGYDYEFVEKVMDVGLNKHHARVTMGYHFSPAWSGHAFAVARIGQGRDSSDFPPPARRTEAWYRHDQLSRHNYAIAGIGATRRIGGRYALSATVGRMAWGRTVHELKRAYEVELSSTF